MVQVCLNGQRSAVDGAAVPVSPQAMADSAAQSVAAGAMDVHVHPKSPCGDDSLSPRVLTPTLEAIRARVSVPEDLTYGADGRRDARLGYAAFDVSADIDGTVQWLDAAELLDGELPLVPRLHEGPYDIERVLEIASGRETVTGHELHLREGVIVRPATERYSPVTGGRAIAKAVSPAYLTRKGGTEYE